MVAMVKMEKCGNVETDIWEMVKVIKWVMQK